VACSSKASLPSPGPINFITICVSTHIVAVRFSRRRSSLIGSPRLWGEICQRHDYHLLRAKVYPDHLRSRYRAGVFDSTLGKALGQYWLRVAAKRGFAIDCQSVLPEHIHLLVRTVPMMSIEECALSLLNNRQHFVHQNQPQSLVQAGIEQLWQSSAYAGTCGKVTTALVKSFLSGRA